MAETEQLAGPVATKGVGANRGVAYGLEGMTSLESRQMLMIDQMIAWAIANPGKKWSDCGRMLGVSAMFCRIMASTDAFKARLAEQRAILLQQCGMATLKEKINMAAEIAVERMAEKLEVAESLSELTDATEVLLTSVYGKSGGGQSAPAITVNQNLILQGRDRIINGEAQEVPGSAPPPALPEAPA